MAKNLTVNSIYELNGIEAVVFNNGRVMTTQGGTTSFLNEYGRGLCSNPSSRQYPACVAMMSAHRLHKLTAHRVGCDECAYGKVAGCWRCGA